MILLNCSYSSQGRKRVAMWWINYEFVEKFWEIHKLSTDDISMWKTSVKGCWQGDKALIWLTFLLVENLHELCVDNAIKMCFPQKKWKTRLKILLSTGFCGKVIFSHFSMFFEFLTLGDNFSSLYEDFGQVIHILSFALPQAIHIQKSTKKPMKSTLWGGFPQSPQDLLFTKTNYLLINLFHYIRYFSARAKKILELFFQWHFSVAHWVTICGKI